jgi:hypothetical protein
MTVMNTAEDTKMITVADAIEALSVPLHVKVAMLASARATEFRCPTCNAGVGHHCIGLIAPMTHPARRAYSPR